MTVKAVRKKSFDEGEREISARMALTRGDKAFYFIVDAVLWLVVLLVLLPIINVIANSFSDGDAIVAGKVTLWPVDFSLQGYQTVFDDPDTLTGYLNTIFYTLAGTGVNLLITIITAYPLSRKKLPGRNVIMMIYAFTMIFNGGLIPNYLLMRDLKFLDTRWVMIIPGALNVYNMIILRTFFASVPEDLWEASEMDGCTFWKYLLRVLLPLSKSAIAVVALYYAVGHWNAYFNAFIYLTSRRLYPLQLVLREVLMASQVDPNAMIDVDSMIDLNKVETIKYALILVSCVPIWIVYPFLQRYFVKGVMIGAIKG